MTVSTLTAPMVAIEIQVTVRDAIANEDGEMIITVGSDNTVKIWSSKGDLINTLHSHTAMVFEVFFNPDGQSFATAANDQTVKIWSLEGELLRTLWHPNEIQQIRYSPDDGHQLLVAHGQTPTLWNLDSEILKITPESRLDSLMTQACTWLKPYLERGGDTDRDRDLCQNN